jgi:hypothetical protein
MIDDVATHNRYPGIHCHKPWAAPEARIYGTMGTGISAR